MGLLVLCYEIVPKKETISYTFINLVENIQKCNIGKCYDLANWLSHYLYFFSFLFFSYLQLQDGVRESIM